MGQSGCLVVAIVLASVVGGILLDRALGTKPLLMLLFVLGSIPVTIYLLFRISMRAVASVKPPPAARAMKDRDDDDNDDEA